MVVTEINSIPYPDPFQATDDSSAEFAAFHARLKLINDRQSQTVQQSVDRKGNGRRRVASTARTRVWDRLSSTSSSDIETVKRQDSSANSQGQSRIVHQEQALQDAQGLLHALQHPPSRVSTVTPSPRGRPGQGYPAGTARQGRRASIAQIQVSKPSTIASRTPLELSVEGASPGKEAPKPRTLRRFSSLPIRGSYASPVLSPTRDYAVMPEGSVGIRLSTAPLEAPRPIRMHLDTHNFQKQVAVPVTSSS